MKKVIINIITIIAVIIMFILILKGIDENVKRINRETAKMSVDWKTYTCSLYWE